MDQNPYAAPKVELVDARAPEPFLSGNWNAGGLRVLAGLSLALLLSELVLLGLSIVNRLPGFFGIPQLEVWLSVLSVLLGCFLSWRCTRFLEDRFSARGLRWPLAISIGMAVLMQLHSLVFDVQFGEVNSLATLAFLLMFLPSGIAQLWYGIRVLKIPLPYPSVKVMGWFDVVTGGCLATVVLFVPGTLLAMVGAIPLALMFLRGARELDGATG
ncbi:hypothetical protein ACYCAX_20365 [Pseudomonas sp. MT3]|uniref:hypothetical protein n=1 Tax=Pseudomonas sp. ATCC 13867 TaxID=1294143 RepID=UPI0002C4E3A8|nr:hypothetical protein [Pseudomonas sp. ATCC 13867]AGI23922.1 hypothetical protein H681_10240 [Pseudomonas sp. ATCC 13867]RFQ39635.1 hypothetical protein D0N87_05070 [Pseudomonas sp. ATCC 13867]RFQ40472.1 hypothetical protein D0N87_03920 [Pseudomonas sp. ATCC 13867]